MQGHVKQIGNKFTKYTKNGSFGFFHRHYFFVDHELITIGAFHFFFFTGTFFTFSAIILSAGDKI